MFLSVFDLFKIGIGPSSSHTMGPMLAARLFMEQLAECTASKTVETVRVVAKLHGSLAFTGLGHATDKAIQLGLLGHAPDTVPLDEIDGLLAGVARHKRVSSGGREFDFDPAEDLVFDTTENLPLHPNGMTFCARSSREVILQREYYSVGGGFVVDADGSNCFESENAHTNGEVPFPFDCADQMLSMANAAGKSIAEMKRANELVAIDDRQLRDGLAAIWRVMGECVARGVREEGKLPGGLSVERRSASIHRQLKQEWETGKNNPAAAMEWLQVYAMAVNEENACGGRVVTAPTNGAAGVIPAVLSYHDKFYGGLSEQDAENFLLTAGAIGGIIKHNASISGAEVGCQGEVGSAAAMAAAGLAAIMGGTPLQVENAAEIALEHHLGMTCDPINGLVQVPCIERNGLGAIKAVSAAQLALRGQGKHLVSLDACIKTMRETGQDMSARYKETSRGGLAVNVVNC